MKPIQLDAPIIVYKVTDNNSLTHGKTKWGPGVERTPKKSEDGARPGHGPMCGPGWIHCYASPRLAALLHPYHLHFDGYQLWEAEASGKVIDDRMKIAVTKLKTIKQIPMPELTIDQVTRFAVLAVAQCMDNPILQGWARNRLNGIKERVPKLDPTPRGTDGWVRDACDYVDVPTLTETGVWAWSIEIVNRILQSPVGAGLDIKQLSEQI